MNKKQQMMTKHYLREVKLEAKRRLITWVVDDAPDSLIKAIWELEQHRIDLGQLRPEDFIDNKYNASNTMNFGLTDIDVLQWELTVPIQIEDIAGDIIDAEFYIRVFDDGFELDGFRDAVEDFENENDVELNEAQMMELEQHILSHRDKKFRVTDFSLEQLSNNK